MRTCWNVRAVAESIAQGIISILVQIDSDFSYEIASHTIVAF